MWNKTSDFLPLEGKIVDTKIDDENGIRNEQKLIYDKKLWWTTDKSIYVYYTPTHWK